MLVIRELCGERAPDVEADDLSLPYDRRRHSRQRACLEGGEPVALMLPRGTVLRGGDVLRCEGGRLVRVRAAPESVSRVVSADLLLLTRAAYHLGNRHVPTQIEAGSLAYPHDHVLDDMVRGLGLDVVVVTAPFEPEPGAYGHGSHSHEEHSHEEHSHAEPSHEHDHPSDGAVGV